jgi:hypothetical protein
MVSTTKEPRGSVAEQVLVDGLGALCDTDVINRLPAKLLFAILDDVCTSEWHEQSKAMQRDRFPSIQFALGHVCRRWYTFVQTTPSFWSKYSLTLSGDTKRTYVGFLKYCLPRSGTVVRKVT